MKITWIQPYYDLILNEIPLNAKVILDVGAGYGIFGFILKKSRDVEVTAIEPFDYDLDHYDFSYQMTWDKFYNSVKLYGLKYDVLVSTEMIEHLRKPQAVSFLGEVKDRANHIIIATPYNWEQQEHYDGNEFQEHKCLVTINDFKYHNYKVKLLGTITIKGLVGRIYFHPKWLKILKLIGVKPTNIIATWSAKYE